MSALDLPASGLAGWPRARARAPRSLRRLATLAIAVTVAATPLTWWLVHGDPHQAHAATLVVTPIALVAIAALGWLVRSAVVTFDGVALRWVVLGVAFAVEPPRLRGATVYRDGLALQVGRGSPWFLAHRDWDGLGLVVDELVEAAVVPTTAQARPAPWRARIQSYGRVPDGLVVAAMLEALVVVLTAA